MNVLTKYVKNILPKTITLVGVEYEIELYHYIPETKSISIIRSEHVQFATN